MKSGPRLPQLEKDLAQKWTPNTTINKLIKKKKMQTLKKKKKKSGKCCKSRLFFWTADSCSQHTPGPDPKVWCSLFDKLMPTLPLHHLLSVKWNATVDCAEGWGEGWRVRALGRVSGRHPRDWARQDGHQVGLSLPSCCSLLPTLIDLHWLCMFHPFGNFGSNSISLNN